MGSARFRVSRLFVLMADCTSIALAQMLAYLFRFEFTVPVNEVNHLLLGVIFLIPFKIIIFYWFGLYRGMWRYTGMRDLQNLFRANIVSSLIIFSALLLINRFEGLSRSIFFMDGVLCFLFTAGFRIVIRIYYSNRNSGVKLTLKKAIGLKNNHILGKNTLLLGAGAAGEALVREIENNPTLDINPVGFLDDDPAKKGLSLHGILVLDGIGRLQDVVTKYKIEQIFLTMPSASASEIRRVVGECEKTGLSYKTLPGIGNLIDGSVSIKDLRDVNYEDLLGRPTVELDDYSISRYIKDKIIMVTGGGGSIGSELCRQILKYYPRRLIILDHSEFNLFNIDNELKDKYRDIEKICILGQVQDKSLLENVFTKYMPQVVYHAAAYKHVHLIEEHPREAVFNNIIGSKFLMDSSVNHKVERFVLVSSDKAVCPTNVMGASKRVTEFIARSLDGENTKLMAVRFGNVVGSSGSVVPLFRKQIRMGGPVTVTHPEATRFFMTISEACKLILQAGALGEGGEIFVLKMGTPVKIIQMAEDLIRLSGKEPYKEIDIDIIGLKKGEKICEELIAPDEKLTKTTHDKIMILCQKDEQMLSKKGLRDILEHKIGELKDAAERCDSVAIKSLLNEVIQEYNPSDLREN